MGRRKTSAVEDIIEIGSMLPWWLSLLAAGASYLLLHSLAQLEPGVATGTKDLSSVMVRQVIRSFALYAQYVVPALLLLGTAISLLKGIKRAVVYDSVTGSGGFSRPKTRDKLDNLTWRKFEELVYEYFHRKGFTVADTAQGPDGGVDLRLKNNDRTATVQCKHWRKKKVDVRIVREQLGVMTASCADECFVVTSGKFTKEARNFAKGQSITLIDGEELRGLLGIFAWDHVDEHRIQQEPHLGCPFCGSEMIMRTARKGRNAGSQFWGCSQFPSCRGTRKAV
jgi:restriction system protein